MTPVFNCRHGNKMVKPLKILLLGSTGSIGCSTCNCVRRHPDRFVLTGLAANLNADRLVSQINEFGPGWICAGSEETAIRAGSIIKNSEVIFKGRNGLEEIAEQAEYDVLLNALVGAIGIRPTVAALKRGKRVALANKESLVIGGEYITSLLDSGYGTLVPVDSEHSAILQCCTGEDSSCIESLILTASGGPFRNMSAEGFCNISPEQALNHPTWSMGKKITIDSGTLMNKGFEVIEAHYLFRLPYKDIRVVIHPQSIVHSMVEFHDGAVIAQCGLPDMELPIQFALSFPQRLPLKSRRLNLAEVGRLDFSEPDLNRFPCLRLAIEAGKKGGTYPVVLNAANEIAVQYFLDGKIKFNQIWESVSQALEEHVPSSADSVEKIEYTDRETRIAAVSRLSGNG
jgi:1-deoxy-D-xylulose-5-phosphate reductoisomerase